MSTKITHEMAVDMIRAEIFAEKQEIRKIVKEAGEVVKDLALAFDIAL